ncbi:hypothetical protein B7C42_07966 [Nocardia cerradoensis]|uniref:Uncharacterized protein n=2 Tax=Nocardia cerradoensis TaxID=85688 RepID=A0A231GTL6_9NOCA|nr:hypothetical protein B7C42_07966 [Nocardia cerradoensis]
MHLRYAQHRVAVEYIVQSASQVMVSLKVFVEGRTGAGRCLFDVFALGGPNALQPQALPQVERMLGDE